MWALGALASAADLSKPKLHFPSLPLFRCGSYLSCVLRLRSKRRRDLVLTPTLPLLQPHQQASETVDGRKELMKKYA